MNWINRKKYYYPIISISLSILAISITLEIVLRIIGYSPASVNPLSAFHEYDSKLGHRGKKLFVGQWKRPEFDVTIAHDSDGFRRQEFQKQASACQRNVFVFGDSFTWGWGVNQGEVFTDRMNRTMPAYCVYNYGINDTGTVVQYVAFDTEVKKKVKPGDTVVVMFFKNDFDDNTSGKKLHAEIVNGQVLTQNSRKPFNSRGFNAIKGNSYFINFIDFKINWLKLVNSRKKEMKKAKLLTLLGEMDNRYIITKHFLKSFKETSADLNANLMVVYIPGQTELLESKIIDQNKAEDDRGYRAALFDIAKSLDIEVIDLLPAFLKYKKNNKNVPLTFVVDNHWNPTGHDLVSQIITDHIIKNPLSPLP